MTKKHNVRMTESQYRTLRRLIFLWFKVAVRRKYSIFQNGLLVFSIILNISFFFMIIQKKKPIQIVHTINIEKALDINNYPSISYSKQTVLKRFNKIYKQYLSDIQDPDHIHIKDGIVDEQWYRYCSDRVRRIINIKSRIRDIEILLETQYPEKIDEIEDVVKKNRHEEILSEMSNYYARFIRAEAYEYILKSSD